MLKPDYLVLINEDNKLPDNFLENTEIIKVKNILDEEYKIEKKTYEAFVSLRADLMENDGIHIELDSVFRTIEKQVQIYEKTLETRGEEYTKKYVALPGHSEHHTGLAVDILLVKDGKIYRTIAEILTVDNIFKEIHKKLAKYGFILRYPEDKQAVTKIGYEPWHLRYLDSPEIATEITNKGICLEEYWNK